MLFSSPLQSFDVIQSADHYNGQLAKFDEYMNAKVNKLKDQVHKNAKIKSKLFNGISIYVNGYTEPPALTLRTLIVENGGEYHHYYSYGHTTYVVANVLSIQKWHNLRNNEKVIRPAWIVACVDAGFLLPEQNFLLKIPLNFSNPLNSHQKNLTSENFNVAQFYQQSRLHLISTLAQDMKKFVTELRQTKIEFPSKKRLEYLSNFENFKTNLPASVICHIDMDCFFVSVAIRSKPELQGKPIAITHSKNNNFQQNKSYSEIASCSYEARLFNVKSGMLVKQALALCPDLICLPYQFEDYKTISKLFYSTVANFTSEIIAVSCDEMYVNLTDLCFELKITDVHAVVKEIRKEIFEVTHCNASVGIGSNILLARLATKKAKPNNQFWIQNFEKEKFMENVNIRDLPGVGHVMQEKLKNAFGKSLENCKQLQNISLNQLQDICGQKIGLKIFESCRGICKETLYDEMLNATTTRKSVSCDVNFGIRFLNKKEFYDFLKEISEQLTLKLTFSNFKGRLLCLKLMIRAPNAPIEPIKYGGHGECNSLSRSFLLTESTSSINIIYETTYKLAKELNPIVSDIRGISLQMTRLINITEIVNNNNISNTDQNQLNIYNFFKKRKTPSPPIDLSYAKNCEKTSLNIQKNSVSKYSTNVIQQKNQKLNLKLKNDVKKIKINKNLTTLNFLEKRIMANLPKEETDINQNIVFKQPCFINGILTIDEIKFDCFQAASKDLVKKLILIFVQLILKSNFKRVKLLINFIERNLFTNKNVNEDWLIILTELKFFINQIVRKKYGFSLF